MASLLYMEWRYQATIDFRWNATFVCAGPSESAYDKFKGPGSKKSLAFNRTKPFNLPFLGGCWRKSIEAGPSRSFHAL